MTTYKLRQVYESEDDLPAEPAVVAELLYDVDLELLYDVHRDEYLIVEQEQSVTTPSDDHPFAAGNVPDLGAPRGRFGPDDRTKLSPGEELGGGAGDGDE